MLGKWHWLDDLKPCDNPLCEGITMNSPSDPDEGIRDGGGPVIDLIRELEKSGVLYPESCPEPGFWHWNVRLPEDLPSGLKVMYQRLGEIRWYG
jgi:hypothetical protein